MTCRVPKKFGVFLPPHHLPWENPHLNVRRDLEFVRILDELGYDEAWIGEHHSSGVETIAAPEVFVAAAAERTRRIRLGTGVSALPYHHPLLLADRIVYLDHLTEGRMMFGAGPGQLPADARMIGIRDATSQRPRMEQALDVILRLFRGETVTEETDWFSCDGAVLQLAPYSNFEIAVTGTFSPNGARLAGRHGLGLISLGGTSDEAIELLKSHWSVMSAESEAHGTTISRGSWRILGTMHIARTFEEAKRDVKHGFVWIYNYLSHLMATHGLPSDFDEAIEFINASGRGVIGTPDMAIELLEKIEERSGGFGTYLNMASDFADWRATIAHYELFMERVVPHFTGQLSRVQRSADEVLTSDGRMAAETMNAIETARASYEQELAARRAQSGVGSDDLG